MGGIARRLVIAMALGLIAGVVALVPPAGATFPGTTGTVAFTSGTATTATDIFVMNADGTGRTPLTATPDVDASAAWSPDGSKIAFVRQEAGAGGFGNPEIWVMNGGGGAPTQLTNTPGDLDQEPAWSPDGTTIVFASTRADPASGVNDLWVMDPTGANVTRLTTAPPNARMPDWSPDGSKIAFAAPGVDGVFDIWVANADGSNPVNLTNSAATDISPAWWPDGSKIAFATNGLSPTSSFDVATIPAAGGIITPLFTTTADEFNPSPSPDGTRIFFDSNGVAPAGAAPANPDGLNVMGCDVPVTACTSGGDGFDPSVQVATDSACPPLTIRPQTLVDGVVGQVYGYQEARELLLVHGGERDYAFSAVDPSTLPPGIRVGTMNPSGTGFIRGTPTTPGTFTFTVQVTDGTPAPVGPCRGTQQYTMVVHCAGPVIRSRQFDTATVGQEYFQTNAASGGTPPYTWSLVPVSSNKPKGIGIDPASGQLLGRPQREGFYPVRIRVTDANGCVDFLDTAIDVAPFVKVTVRHDEIASQQLLVVFGIRDDPGRARERSPKHDLRFRAAPIGGGFGRFFVLVRGTRDKSIKVRAERGFIVCLSAELSAADGDGWGAETCHKVPRR